MLHPLSRSRCTIFAERVVQRFRAWAWTKRPPSWSLVICRRVWRKPTTSKTGWRSAALRSINGPNSCNRSPKARWCRSERGRRLELRRRSHARFLRIKPLALRPRRGVRACSALRCQNLQTGEFEPRSRTGLRCGKLTNSAHAALRIRTLGEARFHRRPPRALAFGGLLLAGDQNTHDPRSTPHRDSRGSIAEC
jgi:hypothetical protein